MSLLRVVVADDDPEILALVTDVLEEAGYSVEAVGDGLRALTSICADPPAVALLDIAMPEMRGDETLRHLRAEGVDVPVIIMTADRNPQRFLALGATAVLPKPFSLTELLAVIARAHSPAPLDQLALGELQDRRPHAPG